MRRTHPFWGIMWYNQLYTFKMCCYTLWHTHPQLVGLLLGETFYHISELSRTTHIWTNQCLIQQLKSRHVGLVTRTKTILPVTLRWAGYAVNNQEILDTSMLWFMKTCESSKLSDENICIIHAHIICMSIIYILLYMQYRHTVLHSWLANHLESIPLINTDQGWSVGHFEHFIDWACSVEHGSTRVQVWVNLSCRVLQLISGPLNEDTW